MTETEQLLAWIFAPPAPKKVSSMRFAGVTIGTLCYATGPTLYKVRATIQPSDTRIRVSGASK